LGDVHEIPFHGGRVDSVCKEFGMEPAKPLWHMDPLKVLREFIDEGSEALVIKARADLFDESWIGRNIDRNFVTEISQRVNVNPCGELGEYHTFAYNGPLFKIPIKIANFKKKRADNYWFLDITAFSTR